MIIPLPRGLSATEIVAVQWNCNFVHKCAAADNIYVADTGTTAIQKQFLKCVTVFNKKCWRTGIKPLAICYMYI